jgi:hypothetical protein
MASVVDNQTKVEVAGKVDSKLDLGDVGGLDRVKRESSNGALGARGGIDGLACSALEERRHD